MTRIISGIETAAPDVDSDPEDNLPLKQLVQKESASPKKNVSEAKCYQEYILKRNLKLTTDQERTAKEKSLPKKKDDVSEAGSKRKQSPEHLVVDKPQPGHPDTVKHLRQEVVSSKENVEDAQPALQDLDDVMATEMDDTDVEDENLDVEEDFEDLRGIWHDNIDFDPDIGQISQVSKV